MTSALLARHPAFHDPAVADISALQSDQQAARDEVAARIEQGQLGMVANPCVCGCTEGELVAGVDRYGLRQETVLCPRCGVLRSDPRMDDDSLVWFYGSDVYRRLYSGTAIMPPDPEKFMRMSRGGQRKRAVICEVLNRETFDAVAEVGCGAGWNLHPFHEAGSTVVGCDFSPELTAFGRQMGMDIRQGDLSVLQDSFYDLVILSHVLEHMPDPEHELGCLGALLKPDGVLYVEVPDLRAFCFDTLQSAHLWYLTPDHLTWLAAKAGLRSLGLRQMGPHFAMLFQPDSDQVILPLPSADGVRPLIRAYDRRQRLKSILRQMGVLSLVQRLRSGLRL